MLGIKMHVLKLRNSMVIDSHTLSPTPSCDLMQLHANWAISAIFGPISTIGYQKACTQAEKFIGGTSRGHWPPEGAKGRKKRPKASNNSPLQELHFLAQSAKIF